MKNHRMGMKDRIRRLLAEMRRDHSPEHFRWAEDELMKLADREDIFITFSDIQKVGLNPQTKHVPAGIYTYPLKEIMQKFQEKRREDPYHWTWNWFMRSGDVPFASDRPYIHVLQSVVPVIDVMEYDIKNLHDEVVRLIDKANLMEKFSGVFRNKEDLVSMMSYTTNYVRLSPMQVLIDTCKNIARYSPDAKVRRSALIVNEFLRFLGYKAISDRTGTGTIHPHEPIQAVFLSKDAVRHVMTLDNKSKMPKGEEGTNTIRWTSGQKKDNIRKNWRIIFRLRNTTAQEQEMALRKGLDDVERKQCDKSGELNMVELMKAEIALVDEFLEKMWNIHPETEKLAQDMKEEFVEALRDFEQHQKAGAS